MMAGASIGIFLVDEPATEALAADIAVYAEVGDVIALSGGLGAGKTTFARAFVRAFSNQSGLEVPSPTFTLLQTYSDGRFPIAHLDLYRINDPAELDEMGFDELSGEGAVLIEWPDRAAGRLPDDRLDMTFEPGSAGHHVRLQAGGNWSARLARTMAIRRFLENADWPGASRVHVQGDASTRRYERITSAGKTAIVMDWPGGSAPSPDSYNGRVGRAWEIGASVDIAQALDQAGLSVPQTYQFDRGNGFLLQEDFGEQSVAVDGVPVPERYQAAVAVLAQIHALPRHRALPAFDGGERVLPTYDGAVLSTEAGLFTEHFLPFARGLPAGGRASAQFREIWSGLCARLAEGEMSWVLRDFHSPNLMWLPQREGPKRIGLLDIQDALYGPSAYDVASLLQDARITIPAGLESELISTYVELRLGADRHFDTGAFAGAYHILGAQRAMKVLGIFANLASERRLERYLAHIPRLRAYLRRNLSHPVLSDLALWYEEHLPRDDQAAP